MPRIVLEIQTGEGSDWTLETLENVAEWLTIELRQEHRECYSGENPPVINILEREE